VLSVSDPECRRLVRVSRIERPGNVVERDFNEGRSANLAGVAAIVEESSLISQIAR